MIVKRSVTRFLFWRKSRFFCRLKVFFGVNCVKFFLAEVA